MVGGDPQFVGQNHAHKGHNVVLLVVGHRGIYAAPDSQRLPVGRLDMVEGDGSAIVAFEKYTGDVRYRLSDELASYASLRLARIAGRPWLS